MWMILLMAAAYAVVETAYFGHSGWPASDAEIVADGIVTILCAMAWSARK